MKNLNISICKRFPKRRHMSKLIYSYHLDIVLLISSMPKMDSVRMQLCASIYGEWEDNMVYFDLIHD